MTDIIIMEIKMLYTVDNVNNIKELKEFFDCNVLEAESLAERGYTVGNIKSYYGDLPSDWLWRLVHED